MRIGAIYEWKQNIRYRVQNPLMELERHGHDVAFSKEGTGYDQKPLQPQRLRNCDVIHAYRLLEPGEARLVEELRRAGAALVWDTDDDLSAVPKESPHYRGVGGLHGQRIWAQTVKLAKLADVVTTSTERLAEKYGVAGIERIEVMPNYLSPEVARSRQRKHDGLVIGWTAGLEHAADLPRIPIVDVLRRLLDAHPQLRVESVGVDLGLPPERYTRYPEVPIAKLQEYVGRWDIGIAPLSDIPMNQARSDVKLKEYASVGIPWLASPIGPYVAYGEAQGGRLVNDDGWFEALDRLVGSRMERFRMGRRARAWAKTQSIERHADRWEAVLAEAVERRGARRAA